MIIEVAFLLAAAVGPVPKAALPTVPGATNPAITQANMRETICAPKGTWSTKSIRPPTSYTNKLKLQQMAALGYTVPNPLPKAKTASGKGTRPDLTKCVARSANPACWEEDHLVPIEIGGAPKDPSNLWVEAWYLNVGGLEMGAHEKDKAENATKRAICSGTISLNEARSQMAKDWTVLYLRFVGAFPSAAVVK